MSVCTWLICSLTSVPLPETASSLTSLYFCASDFALAVMAPIQPWSAAGPEKPMVICLPGASLPPALPPPAAGALAVAVVEEATLLLEQAAAAEDGRGVGRRHG